MQTFRSGGKGGQNQNVRETGVRIIHPPSGAVGESREQRFQWLNKKIAFRRMAESPKFQAWIHAQLDVATPNPRSSERIRTYNFVDNYAKDHRTKKMTADVAGVLDGDLDQLR